MQKASAEKDEMKIVGLSVRTNNQNESSEETSKIGDLVCAYWMKKINESIPDRKNPGVTFGVVTKYENNETGDFTYFIGEEVKSFDGVPVELQQVVVPAGKYQKFTTEKGKMPDVVVNAWREIWQMPEQELGGARKFEADFEVYDQRAENPFATTIDIYVGVK